MKFIMQQSLNIAKDTYTVIDEAGNLVSRVNSKLISIHRKRFITDAAGNIIYIIKGKIIDILPTYFILDAAEREVGKVKKKFSPRAHFKMTLGGKNFNIKGTVFHRSYVIYEDGNEIGRIRKDGFRMFKDKYEIDVANRNHVYVMILLTAIVDMLYFNGKRSGD